MSAQCLLLDFQLPPNVEFSIAEKCVLKSLKRQLERNNLDNNLVLLVKKDTAHSSTAIYTGVNEILITIRWGQPIANGYIKSQLVNIEYDTTATLVEP